MFYAFLFIFGLAIGSFLNVLIDRLSHNESINGRSHCDHCRHQLAWYDLIPVISFILLGAKCRYCRKKLSFFYPLVELLTGVLFIFTGYQLQATSYLFLWTYLVIISCLIVVFFSDAKYHIIPDQIQILLFIGALILLPLHGFIPQIFFDRVIGSIVVMLPILFLYYLTRGGGMGFGDVKLAFVIGFLLGWKQGAVALYIAFIFGAIFGLVFMLFGRRGLKSKIAFGPFLVTGIFIMLFWGETIINFIKRFYGF